MVKNKLFAMILISMYLSIFSGNTVANITADSECVKGEYVPFNKIHFDVKAFSEDEFYIVDRSQLSEKEKKEILFTLDYYRVPYKLTNQEILIECHLKHNNKEMNNLTVKSENPVWHQMAKENMKKFDELGIKRSKLKY